MIHRLLAGEARTGPDRCPGGVVLHEAQDGALARIRVPGGRLTSDQLLALARAARGGNGLVDLTSRANLQVRGLGAGAAADLTELLADAGLLPSVDHDRARNVIASPVAGRHPQAVADTDRLVAELDAGLCRSPQLAALPGRFLFAVDDGSRLALEPSADVTLRALPGCRYLVEIAAVRVAEPVDADDAAAVALAAARGFLRVRAAAGSRAWRIGELDRGPERVAHELGVELLAPEPQVDTASRLGLGPLRQRDGRVAVTALAPLGRLDGDMLTDLAELAPEVRLSVRRTMTITDVDPDGAGAAASALARLGMVLDAESGWVGLTACAGRGRCPQARTDVRGAAARRASVRPAGAPAEHWTACERACGRRAEQAITVTATGGGQLVRVGEREHAVVSVQAALELLSGGST